MQAALFNEIGKLPQLAELPDPQPQAGDVVVDVIVAPVLTYAAEVFAGQRPMLFNLPFVPGTGAIGRVASVGADATGIARGMWVYCDPTLRTRDGEGQPAIALQGLTANGPAALPVQARYPNGSWAQKLALPIENVVPIGEIDVADAARWLVLATMLVPFGGLLSVDLSSGETLVVNGATGSFGSAAVAVALAMGASRVVATGRSSDVLHELAQRFGPRVAIAEMTGRSDEDTATIQAAASGPIDVVFDILPPQATSAQVLAAIRAVRPGGRVSLMGGVGMGNDDPLILPYPWLMRNNITIRGQWMYPRSAIARLVSMATSGTIDLSHYTITEFPLSQVEQAIAHATCESGPFHRTVIRP